MMFKGLFRKKNFDSQLTVIISRAEPIFKDTYESNSKMIRRISGKIDRINREFHKRYDDDLFVNYATALTGCHNVIERVNESTANFTSLASLLNGCLNDNFLRRYLGPGPYSCNAERCRLRDFIQHQNLPIGCIFDNINNICLFRNAFDHPEDFDLKQRAEIQISNLIFRRSSSKMIEEMELIDFQNLWKKSLELANDALIDLNSVF